MTRRVLSFAILLSSLFAAGRARAETRAVLLIGGGAQFREALVVALSPWELRVVPLDAPPPRPTMPRAADEARALAQQSAASGLVWVALDQNEPSLWVYDASTDQVVTRKIATPPPFDAPTAAAAALSVKALLRSSTVAPPSERIGATAVQSVPGPTTPPPGPLASDLEPLSVDAPSPADKAERSTLRAEIEGAGRSVASELDLRASLGLSAWLGAQKRFGIGLSGAFGPGLAIDAARFAGRFSEVDVTPSARLRVPLSTRLGFEPRIGMSLHATSINGVAVLTSQTASRSRLDGSVDAAIALDVLATRSVGLALDVGVSWLLRYQRYLVETTSVLELQPIQAFAGLRLSTSVL
jgi:hypothetical protein